jgi:lysophospholipid acyltransferase (LPLAT)-like uncharacterized protein
VTRRLWSWFILTLVPAIATGLIRVLGRTLQIRSEGFDEVEGLYKQGKTVIFAFWHARQLMMPLVYPGKKAAVLISQHRDGELIHRIVARFGIKAVRGSTTRGGGPAFRRLVELGRAGSDLGITPDGPKGPRQVVQQGVIRLAKVTGQPIVPVTFSCSKKKSSRAGTAFWFPIPSAVRCLSAGNRSGSRPMPPRRSLRRNAVSWKPS